MIIKPEFYHASIKITQVPDTKGKSLEDSSWLCDPFGNAYVYGTQFTINDQSFSWKFFFKEESKADAIKNGHKFIAFLKEIYPGLSGVVKAKPISSKKLDKKEFLYEIVLPKPPFYKKMNLFRKIINLFTINKKHLIKIYILWQKDDSIIGGVEETDLEREYRLDENYKIKIFLSFSPKFDDLLDSEDQMQELIGQIEYLTTDLYNSEGVKAYIKQASEETWENILSGRVFWKNLQGIITGRFYEGIKDKIPEDKIPEFVNPKVVDFNIPEYMLIKKANQVRNENIDFTQKPNKDEIILGKYVSRGIITEKEVPLSINDLVHHTGIWGLTGVGKTKLVNYLQNEISVTAPNCGTLIFGLRKSGEDQPYNLDITLRYGDPDFRVPYYFKGENVEVTFEQLAALLSASQGLKQPVDIVMFNAMNEYFRKNKNLPDTLKALFGRILKWFETHRYHKKYQTNIINAIKNRVLRWVSSPILEEITKLPSIKPYWFIEWMNGKNVFIDLSEDRCNLFMKKLIISLIFQMVRIFFPQMKYNGLKNLIIMEEVGRILNKPSSHSSNDDDFISQYFLEEVFRNFLEAFRSRGIGLILTAQDPSELFESVYSLPSIQIIFRIGHLSSRLFTNDREEQDSLSILEKRMALVKDGVNGRKFAIYTIDFNKAEISHDSKKKPELLCPICENYRESYDNFCSSCGTSFNSDSHFIMNESKVYKT